MPNAIGEALALKRQKAERYAKEPLRFRLDSLAVTMQSEHDDRLITFGNGTWSCSCDFFAAHRTCSHLMAIDILLSQRAGMRLRQDHQVRQE